MTNREKNIKYWTERAERNFVAGEKDALQVAKELQANYKRCIKEIEEKINAFYGKYANQNGLTLEEAKKLLDRTELKSFKENIEDMLKMGDKSNFTSEEINQFNLLKIKAKISRLDELETNIRYELDKLTSEKVNAIGNMLENTYEEGYYKAVYDAEQFKGFSSSFGGLNKEAVEKAVKNKWLNSNYVETLWQNNLNRMTKMLNTEIPRGITLGYNPRKLAKQVSKEMQFDYNATVRVIRTEYSKVLNDATLQGYKASGIDEYEILATLEQKDRTCEDCKALDYRNSGKAYKIEEAETSVNFPPFHPNCYDKETEVYTNNGWKYFKDLNNDDLVYTLNPKTLETEYLEPKNHIKYKITGYMYNYTTKDIDLCVTGHHQMFIKEKNKGFMFVPAWRLLNFKGYLFDGDKKSQKYIPINELILQRINYDDYVYCVELEKYHTLLVRRNGQVCWCGNCRCTTVPHFEEDEIDRMSDEELSKIGFITYDEWKNGLIHLEGNKVIYEKGVKIDD